jgi:hypothetical protein
MFYKTFTVYNEGLITHARRYVAYMSNDVEKLHRTGDQGSNLVVATNKGTVRIKRLVYCNVLFGWDTRSFLWWSADERHMGVQVQIHYTSPLSVSHSRQNAAHGTYR